MLPLALFRDRTFAATNAVSFFMYAALFGTLFLMGQFFQIALGNSPLSAGLRLLPWTAAPMVIAPIAGAVLASVFARHAAYTSPQVFVDGFTEALWVGVGLSALGSAAALLVPGPRRAVEASAAPAALAMHDPIAETT